MPIEVELPDGSIAEFPDGTAPDVIKGALSKRFAAPAAKPEAPSTLAAGAEGVAQGLTFGFADELEGAARALYGKYTGDGSKSFGQLYDDAVAIPRKRITDAKTGNPLAFYGGEIASSFAVPGGLAKLGIRGPLAASAGAGLGARSVAAAKEGAAYGAAYGAGTAEGGLGDRLTGAAGGGAMGGVLGAAAPGAIDLASNAARFAGRHFRGVTNPQGVAAEKVGEAVARDLSTTPNEYGNAAARFATRFDDMARANPAVRAMDAGGENVRNLMRSAVNVPNQSADKAKRVMDARQGTQYKRIEDDLARTMGNDRNYFEGIDMLSQRLDRIGAEQLAPVLRTHETPMTDALRAVLARPTMKELHGLVSRKLADEGQAIGFETRTQMIHRMKMELDDQIGQAVRAEKMGNKPQAGWDKGTLTILKRDLLKAVDNPQYKAGLKNYASQAQLKNAAEDGYEAFMKSQPEEIRATLRGFDNDAQRDFYRMGAIRAINERVRTGNANRDRTDGVFSSPDMQMKLKAVFPSQRQLREFQRSLVVEARMADSRKAMQGNSTTAKQLAHGEDAGKTARGIMSLANAATGRLEPIMNLIAQGASRFSGLTPRVASEVIELGLSKDPRVLNELARAAMEQAGRVPQVRASRAQKALPPLGLLALTGTEPTRQ